MTRYTQCDAQGTQKPAHEELTAVVRRCYAREMSINDAAAAVHKLFAPSAPTASALQLLLNGALVDTLSRCFSGERTVEPTVKAVYDTFAAATALRVQAPMLDTSPAQPSPCPFCGSKLEGSHDDQASFYSHPKADCMFSEWEFDGLKVQQWNQRVALRIERVTMTGHQLQAALDLAWPDGASDPAQGETVVNITQRQAGPALDEQGIPIDLPAGLYLSYDDLPEEGIVRIPDEPESGDVRADGANR